MAKLVSRLHIIAKEYEGAAESAVRRTAADIRDYTESLAPRDSGTLAGSYEARQGRNWTSWFIGTTVHYAPYMEYGFRHWKSGQFIGPYPHLTPAFWRAEPQFRRYLIQAVKAQKDTT